MVKYVVHAERTHAFVGKRHPCRIDDPVDSIIGKSIGGDDLRDHILSEAGARPDLYDQTRFGRAVHALSVAVVDLSVVTPQKALAPDERTKLFAPVRIIELLQTAFPILMRNIPISVILSSKNPSRKRLMLVVP